MCLGLNILLSLYEQSSRFTSSFAETTSFVVRREKNFRQTFEKPILAERQRCIVYCVTSQDVLCIVLHVKMSVVLNRKTKTLSEKNS